MINIRNYNKNDAQTVGLLIKDTYSEFNLDFLAPEDLPPYLGPFAFADQQVPGGLEDIHAVILSKLVFVAETEGQAAGVLRGRLNRLGSLFIAKQFQRLGIGRALVEHFESAVRSQGSEVIRVASSLYAVPFYLRMGYKKSTGIRRGWSFEGHGIPIQPMKKNLK